MGRLSAQVSLTSEQPSPLASYPLRQAIAFDKPSSLPSLAFAFSKVTTYFAVHLLPHDRFFTFFGIFLLYLATFKYWYMGGTLITYTLWHTSWMVWCIWPKNWVTLKNELHFTSHESRALIGACNQRYGFQEVDYLYLLPLLPRGLTLGCMSTMDSHFFAWPILCSI